VGREGQREKDGTDQESKQDKSTGLTKRLSLFVPHVTALILPPPSTRQTGRGLQNTNDYMRLHEPESCNCLVRVACAIPAAIEA
jgi:hypothetical protein